MEKNKRVQMKQLSKKRGDQTIVRNWSAHLHAGEIAIVVGPNGAGKSTITKMLTGELKPDAGDIWVGSAHVSKNPLLYRKQIGYMPDKLNMDISLTCFEFLSYYASLYGKKQSVVTSWLRRVELEPKQSIKKLSKGMTQRLLLARALFTDPSFLILDEPTNGLDQHWLQELKEILTSFQQTGGTIWITTHDESFAQSLEGKTWRLQNGEMISAHEWSCL